MAEQEKIDESRIKQQEIKDSIKPYLTEIKSLADSFLAALEKKEVNEAALDNAFDLNDAIQEQTQEINALLFDLRVTIQ